MCIQRWIKHLLKSIFWAPHSDYANYLRVVHASEISGMAFFNNIFTNTYKHKHLPKKKKKKNQERIKDFLFVCLFF